MGAALSQLDEEGRERMIACFSKKFVKAQTNYSTTDIEALAVEKGIVYFDHYLREKRFSLKTALNHNIRILRIALKLQEYDFILVYIQCERNPQQTFRKSYNQYYPSKESE